MARKTPFPSSAPSATRDLVQAVREGRKREFAAFAWQGEVPDPHAETTFAAARLSWSWPEGSPRAGLRRLYADLLTARREWPALRDFVNRKTRLLPEGEGVILELIRGGCRPERGKTVKALFNLTGQSRPLPADGVGHGAVRFSSEAGR